MFSSAAFLELSLVKIRNPDQQDKFLDVIIWPGPKAIYILYIDHMKLFMEVILDLFRSFVIISNISKFSLNSWAY